MATTLLFHPGCVKVNQAPGCRISEPGIGEMIPHGTLVNISVDAEDADGDVYGVTFYINDSSIGISNSIPFQYQWNSVNNDPGTHTIRTTAKDDSGDTSSDEITVTLTEGVPVADFSVYQTSICPDSSAQFYSRSINNPKNWLWDFGDGNSSTIKNPSHRFRIPGEYTVSLKVTNSYGSDMVTKTGYIIVTEPVTDYDGNKYQTVQIGAQLWMRENLKTTHYADGTVLMDGTGAGDLSDDFTSKYQFAYGDDESNVSAYGRLYTWAAVMNGESGGDPGRVQGVCPDGWHVPDDDEWQELEVFLGFTERQASQTGWRGSNQGLVLRETGAGHWSDIWRDYIAGTNESGFSALPGGSRLYNQSFANITEHANFWSATESLASFAWSRRLYYNYSMVYRYDDYKSRGYSVRCVKDQP